MPRKGKKRREAHRQRAQSGGPPPDQPAEGQEQRPAAPSERIPSARPAVRKPARRAARSTDMRRIWRIVLPVGATLAVVGGIVLIIVLIATSGSTGGESVVQVSATPDPRLGGQAAATTVQINANDNGQQVNARFEPNTVTGKAGEVIAIELDNVGSVAHNLRVAGLNNQYDDTPPGGDDWVLDALQPGEQGTLRVKINQAGTYNFRCDLHPTQQFGTLVLQ